MHIPVFIAEANRDKTSKAFKATVKEDVLATIEFLYKRGMWSKFHYEKWKAEAERMTDEALLHGWWDAIVNSAMYEMEFEEFFEYKEGLAKTLYNERKDLP